MLLEHSFHRPDGLMTGPYMVLMYAVLQHQAQWGKMCQHYDRSNSTFQGGRVDPKTTDEEWQYASV